MLAFALAFMMVFGNTSNSMMISFADEIETQSGEEAGGEGGNEETGGEESGSEETGNEESGNEEAGNEESGNVEPGSEETTGTEGEKPEEVITNGGNGQAGGAGNKTPEVPEAVPNTLEKSSVTFEPVEIEDVIVTVEVLDAELEEDVTLSVTTVEDTEEIEQALVEKLSKEGKNLNTFKAFDIKLLNAEGEEVEPKAGTLKVSFLELSAAELLSDEDAQAVEEGVFHVKDNDELVDMDARRNDETGELEFTTTHFSVFVPYTTGDGAFYGEQKSRDIDHSTKWAVELPEFGIQSESITEQMIPGEKDSKGRIHDAKAVYTIAENAEGDLYTYLNFCDPFTEYIYMPGDTVTFDVEIVNNSGHIYRYKDNSFGIGPAVEDDNFDNTQGFHGYAVPAYATCYRIKTTALKDLLKDVTKPTYSTEEIWQELEKQGYSGENALAQYYVDYYNELNAAKYPNRVSDAQVLDDFDLNTLAQIYGNNVSQSSGVLETDPEVIDSHFNFCYNALLNISYDGTNPTASIGDSMRNLEEANEVVKSTFGRLESGTSAAMGNPIKLNISGPYMGNAYNYYSWRFLLGLSLEQVDHNLTINYFNLDNGSAMCDSYQETIYIEESYDVTAEANKAFDGFKLVKMDGNAVTGTGDTDKVINVYYSAQENPTIPDSHTITVNYYEKGTTTKLADTFTTTQLENSSYNVTDRTQLAISGYTWDSCDNTATEGSLTADIVFNVYYTKNDSTTPTYRPSGGGGSSSGTKPGRGTTTTAGGPGVTTTINEEQVPMAQGPETAPVSIPETDVPLAPLPKTGDTTGHKNLIMLLMSSLMLAVYVITKRKEETE